MPNKIMKTKSRHKNNLRIALTGGFCTGKTTVLLIFKSLGAHTFDCDAVAHRALWKNSPVYKALLRTFGRSIIKRGGRIDRKKLGALVFTNKQKLRMLEKIIHPYVVSRMHAFFEHTKGLCIAEVPLLFEARLERHFNRIIVVAASNKTIVARARSRFPHLSRKEIVSRITSQLPLERKKKKADFIIHNNELKKTITQTKHIWSSL